MTTLRQQYRPRRIIQSFEAKALKKRPLSVKIADSLTGFFGSIPFFLLNLGVFVFWILVNNGKVPGLPIFDPYPHILLTTTVSLEAIILTIIVLMSQNRQSFIGSVREEMDLQVNLITEREITKVLEILKQLAAKQGIKLTDDELTEMLKEIDTPYLERQLEKELSGQTTSIAKVVGQEVEKVVSKF